MANSIENRSEILFLYDVTYANPNGDPADMNRPRLDEDSMKCLVTDVRLKRTIRDYIDQQYIKNEGNDIFIKEMRKADDNTVYSIKMRIDEIRNMIKENKKKKNVDNTEIADYILANFIDTRLFGATYPTGDDSIQFTGPVQFNIGRSLNKVKEVPFTLSTVMASDEGKKSGSLAEAGKKTIKYGLIAFDGLVNENTARHSKATMEDLKILMKALWWGTKELNTTSKNQKPVLLLKVDYKPDFYLGELSSYLKMENNDAMEDERLESTADYVLNTKLLNSVLEKHSDKITGLSILKDDRLEISEEITNAEALKLD